MRSLICTFVGWALRFHLLPAYCLFHRTEPHLHASSPNVCDWQKRSKQVQISKPLRSMTWLNHTVAGEAAKEHSDLRARLCVRAPPRASLGGQHFLNSFFISFSFHPKSQFPFEWLAAQWHSLSMCSVRRHFWANTRPFCCSKVHVFSSGNS